MAEYDALLHSSATQHSHESALRDVCVAHERRQIL